MRLKIPQIFKYWSIEEAVVYLFVIHKTYLKIIGSSNLPNQVQKRDNIFILRNMPINICLKQISIDSSSDPVL